VEKEDRDLYQYQAQQCVDMLSLVCSAVCIVQMQQTYTPDHWDFLLLLNTPNHMNC